MFKYVTTTHQSQKMCASKNLNVFNILPAPNNFLHSAQGVLTNKKRRYMQADYQISHIAYCSNV